MTTMQLNKEMNRISEADVELLKSWLTQLGYKL